MQSAPSLPCAPAAAWSALIVDADPDVRQSLRLSLEADGAHVLGVGSAAAAVEAIGRARYDVVVLDAWAGLDAIAELRRGQAGVAVIVTSANASCGAAVDAMRRGATDYLPKPIAPDQIRGAVRRARPGAAPVSAADDFTPASRAVRTLLERSARVAAADVPILLRGESGSGKNVHARWLWQHGPRAGAAFVSVNCPALSSELMNSALFGHKRGAFTGAACDAPGKVQDAEGGTLFLDEVGDLSLDAQARLLRFLNDGTYERVGEPRERRADVRVIAATNRPLEDDVRAGRFRADLLFRLDVVTLTLPALRDRREDVLPLARHYRALAAARRPGGVPELSAAAERAIAAYRWPGNLRELRNAVDRAAILAAGPELEPDDLGLPDADTAVAPDADRSLDAMEREHIARVVAGAPTLDAAARILGIDISTLTRKRKRYGLT